MSVFAPKTPCITFVSTLRATMFLKVQTRITTAATAATVAASGTSFIENF